MKEQMREKFEANVTKLGIIASFNKNADGNYKSMQIQYLFAIWQAALASQAQQPTAYRVIASANGEVVRDSLEFTRMSEIDEKVVRKSYDLEIIPLFASQAQQGHIGDSTEMVETLRDSIAGCLTSVYVCARAWSAWGQGTMSQDDFIQASETEFLDDLVTTVIGVMKSQAQQQMPTGTNAHGLDARYFHGKLSLILRDIGNYKPDEMHCALSRLADVARPTQAQPAEPLINPANLPPEWIKNVSRMWQCVRKHDCSIPDYDLDLMREILLKAKQPATVTLTGHQIRCALALINPDEADQDQLDDCITFGIVKHCDDDGVVGTGMACWNDDTDGVLPLDDALFKPVKQESWISVEDRLPKVEVGSYEFFLVTALNLQTHKESVFEAAFLNEMELYSDDHDPMLFSGWHSAKESKDYDGWYEPLGNENCKVTHWMGKPLPPVKEVTE